MDEIKEYTRGMAECVMWRPSLGLELCMRQFWIEQGIFYGRFVYWGRANKCVQGGELTTHPPGNHSFFFQRYT